MFENLNPIANDELTEKRRAICAACPKLVEISFIKRCSECGCFIDAKTAIKAAECPLKKW